MSTSNKDKRTKEQLLQILSNALTQEELLSEKIKTLETQLAVCQKQKEESQAEISQYGVSASKESFRIDYYKASENGRLKGIIEHLPSRQKKSLQGMGIKHIAQFMERFLPEEVRQKEKVALPIIESNLKNTTPLPQDEATGFEKMSEKPSVIQDVEKINLIQGGKFPLGERLRAQFRAELPNIKRP